MGHRAERFIVSRILVLRFDSSATAGAVVGLGHDVTLEIMVWAKDH